MRNQKVGPTILKNQRKMLRAVYGAKQALRSTPELALYRELTQNALLDSIQSAYPAICLFLESTKGAQSWQSVAEKFFAKNPPRDFRLARAPLGWPATLKPRALQELALYEWARFEAVSARGPQAEDITNPSLELLMLEHDAPSWSEKILNRKRGYKSVPKKLKSPLFLAVFRTLTQPEEIRSVQLTPLVFAVAQGLQQGLAPHEVIKELARGKRAQAALQEIFSEIVRSLRDEQLLMEEKTKLSR